MVVHYWQSECCINTQTAGFVRQITQECKNMNLVQCNNTVGDCCELTSGRERIPTEQTFSRSLRADRPTASGRCVVAGVAEADLLLQRPSYSRAPDRRTAAGRYVHAGAAWADTEDWTADHSRQTDIEVIRCWRGDIVRVPSGSSWTQTTFHNRDTSSCQSQQPLLFRCSINQSYNQQTSQSIRLCVLLNEKPL